MRQDPAGPLSLSPAPTALQIRNRAGRASVESVVRHCLDRIREREPVVQAWAHLDPDHALAQARALDALDDSRRRGPLHGVPVGVKDIFATFDLPTELGSPIHRGSRPRADASSVARVRAAGAVILGKTVTCEFADKTPGPTTNPHDPSRTPGGSSSGSAAAVADGMVPVAFGTQTAGSILRPSSFCGIVGFKPSYNAINRQGLAFSAESLDTIGFHARSVDDVDLLAAVLCDRAPEIGRMPEGGPVLGLCRTPLWHLAEPESVEAVEDSARRLAAAGAEVREVTLPPEFEGLAEARARIHAFERARALAWEWNTHRDLLSEGLRESLRAGFDIPRDDYVASLDLAARCRARLPDLYHGFDAFLGPCVVGEAPMGRESTGDPTLQGFWTVLHGPTLTLPTHRGPSGLPVGIHLAGPLHQDSPLLRVARWVWEVLGVPGPVPGS